MVGEVCLKETEIALQQLTTGTNSTSDSFNVINETSNKVTTKIIQDKKVMLWNCHPKLNVHTAELKMMLTYSS